MDINKKYLPKLYSECLMQNYYLEAGYQVKGMQTIYDPESAGLHRGESPTCRLREHFLGHRLSAAAHMIRSSDLFSVMLQGFLAVFMLMPSTSSVPFRSKGTKHISDFGLYFCTAMNSFPVVSRHSMHTTPESGTV